MSNRPGRAYIYLPIVFALLIVAGMFLGRMLNFTTGKSQGQAYENLPPDEKISEVLKYITEHYVDSVDHSDITEKAIEDLLHNLDPHSSYISAKELKDINEQLEGNFEGIGIEFNIVRDTICVVSVIAGGPSQKAGLLAGDKIITVEGKTVAGTNVKNKDVTSLLRGPKGTDVKVGVMRNNQPKLIGFVITRDEIPLYSLDVAYMLDDNTGYIKLSRFAETSYIEFMEAIQKLRKEGMKDLVFDLRGNGGGLLNIAVDIADEFLEKGKMIVYTEGRHSMRKNYTATSKGALTAMPVVVLIDENSASASEIVAGALQDNDRGMIMGRRSFGKGLVQQQTQLPDGSAIRLTTARYYTPTGRCIQKPYNKGLDDYYNEEQARFESGELQHADSIKFPDSLKFHTPKGKTVYGGGGIMPDVFVPLDTSGRTPYLSELFYKSVFNQFSFDYADKKRVVLSAAGLNAFRESFRVDETLFREFIQYAEKNGVKRNEAQIKKSEQLIRNYLKASIARSIWNNEGFYPIYNQDDKTMQQAVEYLNG
ncbi:MAG: S41 family peptidase [Bacteroidota bacterium]